jgi:DNA-binding NarL/FixJ family response regulator
MLVRPSTLPYTAAVSDNTEPSEALRILIVDDHPLFQEALHELIQREPGWSVCGKAADATEALRLVEETHPDLMIVDISLGGTNGIDLIKSVSAKYAELPMLVVSMHDESLYSERAIRAGAMGYVMKHESPKTVKAAIQQVLAGELYLSHKMATSLIAKLIHGEKEGPKESPFHRLTDRELEVYRLLGQGKNARQIAQELDLSVATINSFRARIREKLHLKNSTELLLQASNWVREQAEGNLPASP